MREIKFRFWDKEEKEWLVDGGPDDGYENDIYDFAFMKGDNWTYISREEARKRVEVIQYTGLEDINGKEIYEGDILMGRGNIDDLTLVAFGQFGVINMEGLSIVDNVVGWHTKAIPTDGISRAFPFCLDMPLTKNYVDLCGYEVIDNVYENPELLEVE